MYTSRHLSIGAAARLGARVARPLRPKSIVSNRTVNASSTTLGQGATAQPYGRRNPINLAHISAPRFFSSRPSNAQAATAAEAVDQDIAYNDGRACVTIPLDGSKTQISAVLLRDACSCPRCVHESTNQRLFSTADIPANVRARVVEVDAASDSVKIKWDNDVAGYDDEHATTFGLAELQGLAQTGSLPVTRRDSFGSPSLWSEKRLELPDYDYESYLKNDHTLFQLMKQLHTYGLAFVTNIPGKETSLATIATRMGPIKDTFYGQTWDVRTVPAAINAAYTSHDLGFHTDLLYFQQPPHIQLLHCIQSASSGGASVFADAYKAAVDLFHSDLEAFETLATVPVNYQYNHPHSNVYRTTKPVIDLRPLRIGETVYTSLSDYKRAWHDLDIRNGGAGWNDSMLVDCLDKINWGPPFLAPFSNHPQSTHDISTKQPTLSTLNDKVERWHQAAVKFNALLQRSSYLYERKMNPGECVLFDNTRTLHSRRAFDSADVGKPRWLRGTYVDKDPFFSKMRVLKHTLG
ncbi:Nn.00g114920.m01.CDS01 [Neocucurbitaria sp. VM-36]